MPNIFNWWTRKNPRRSVIFRHCQVAKGLDCSSEGHQQFNLCFSIQFLQPKKLALGIFKWEFSSEYNFKSTMSIVLRSTLKGFVISKRLWYFSYPIKRPGNSHCSQLFKLTNCWLCSLGIIKWRSVLHFVEVNFGCGDKASPSKRCPYQEGKRLCLGTSVCV